MSEDRPQEGLHLALFVDNVVSHKHAAGVQPWVDHVEELLVVGLPGIEEDKIERARQLRDLGERIAMHHAHDIRDTRASHVVGRFPRALRIVLDRDDAPAGLARAQAEPDAAVAAGGANLENRLRPVRGHQHSQESAVLFRDGQKPLVGGLDRLQHGLDVRRNHTSRLFDLRGVRHWQEQTYRADGKQTHGWILRAFAFVR